MRLEIYSQLDNLEKILGKYMLYGITKGEPVRINNFTFLIHPEDLINAVLPIYNP